MDALALSAKSKEFEMPNVKCRPPVRFLLSLSVSVAALAIFSGQAIACFTVYNKANVPVYSNMSPPIDMSYQIHQRLPAVFPGGHMVFGDSYDCPLIDARVPVAQLSNVSTNGNLSGRRIRRESRN